MIHHFLKSLKDQGSKGNQPDLTASEGRMKCPGFCAVLIQEIADIQGQEVGDLDELGDVQSTISRLVFGYVALWLSELGRHLHLRHSRILTSLREQPSEDGVLTGVERLDHDATVMLA